MIIPIQSTAETVLPKPRANPVHGRVSSGANAWLSRLVGFQLLLLVLAAAGSWSTARHPREAPAAPTADEVPVIDFPIEQVGTEAMSPEVPAVPDLPADAPTEPIVPGVVPEVAMDEVLAPAKPVALVEALPPPPEASRPAPDVLREPPPRPAATAPSSATRPPARPSTRTPPGASGTGTPGAPALFGGVGTGRFPLPPYPSEARRRGLEGNVMLLVEVSAQGQPGVPRIESSSGHASLDRAAIDWIRRRWRWEAGPPRYFRIPIKYQLE